MIDLRDQGEDSFFLFLFFFLFFSFFKEQNMSFIEFRKQRGRLLGSDIILVSLFITLDNKIKKVKWRSAQN